MARIKRCNKINIYQNDKSVILQYIIEEIIDNEFYEEEGGEEEEAGNYYDLPEIVN